MEMRRKGQWTMKIGWLKEPIGQEACMGTGNGQTRQIGGNEGDQGRFTHRNS
jgi:hypothetical protein